MRILVNLIAGILFGLGLLVSGMANPAKVINFLDLAGTWDPSLAFVMAGAIAVALPGYRLVFRRSAPVLSDRFRLPTRTAIDYRLVLGAAVFGIGWGLGLLPGPCVIWSAASQGNACVRARDAGRSGARAPRRLQDQRRSARRRSCLALHEILEQLRGVPPAHVAAAAKSINRATLAV